MTTKFKCILSFSTGSTEDGVDVLDNVNVGVTNHVSFHGLHLQNGHQYYVKVTGDCLTILPISGFLNKWDFRYIVD